MSDGERVFADDTVTLAKRLVKAVAREVRQADSRAAYGELMDVALLVGLCFSTLYLEKAREEGRARVRR